MGLQWLASGPIYPLDNCTTCPTHSNPPTLVQPDHMPLRGRQQVPPTVFQEADDSRTLLLSSRAGNMSCPALHCLVPWLISFASQAIVMCHFGDGETSRISTFQWLVLLEVSSSYSFCLACCKALRALMWRRSRAVTDAGQTVAGLSTALAR